MTEQEAQTILEQVAEEVGGVLHDDYSGRGMFGTTCFGITCDHAFSCVEAAAARGIRGASWDQMGKKFIVYWPRLVIE